ncbi:hypothetical protein MMC08_003397 [Hypocenomyce scalaris]|nr:hypothetical protein [Hypocenomyce scalaris]
MTAAATEVVSALSSAAAISGNTSPAPSTAQLVTPSPTPIAQQTLSEYSSISQSQSTADATALQPTSPLTQASVNGILLSAAGIIPTSGGVIVVEPTSNGRTPAQTSIFMATSSQASQASSSTATISRLSSATTARTISSVSIKPATASSLATDHNPSTNSKGPVVGGAIGGVAVVATVLLVILLCCRRRKRVKREQNQEQTVVDQRYVVTLDTRSR